MILILSGEGPTDLGACAKTRWQDKWDSICHGFTRGGHSCGVGMLPKPKSEAWLLALVQKLVPAAAAKLEALPGNDAAPHSAKVRLVQAMGQAYSAQEWCEWVGQDHIDLSYLEHLPSFVCFYQQLIAALAQVMAQVSASPPARN